MISRTLMRMLDTAVIEGVETAMKVANGEVSVRPRDQRLSGALLVMVAHVENLLMRLDESERGREKDRRYIEELQGQLPADSDRQARALSKERIRPIRSR